MKRILQISISILVSLAYFGCVLEFNAELPYNSEDVLVVDGTILSNSETIITLGKGYNLNETGRPKESYVTNATVYIVGDNGYVSEAGKMIGNGAYSFNIGILDPEVSYGVQIDYNGDSYTSTPSKPFYTPEIDSVSWAQSGEANVVFRISTHEESTEPRYYLWSYEEDWEIAAPYETTVFYDPKKKDYYIIDPAPYHYCWKRNTINTILTGTTESLIENRIINKTLYEQPASNDRFSILYSVLIKQKSISKDAYDYFLNVKQSNEEMGGLFTPQPSESGGNLTCLTNPNKHVVGYITVANNITSKRIFIDSNSVKRPRIFTGCELLNLGDVNMLLDQNQITLPQFYGNDYRPALDPAMGTTDAEFWSTEACTDCRAKGGTKNKPDFWPNNHE